MSDRLILMADDDEEDCELAIEALREARLRNEVRTVPDGVALLDYLKQRGDYAAPGAAPRPMLILLDLNMPKMDGLAVLEALKADEALAPIPVIVLTTSSAEPDVEKAYARGAASYIVKPVSFNQLVEKLHTAGEYWFEVVETPRGRPT